MTGFILGIDIAKKKFGSALLINGKLKHKVFANSQDGFSELTVWLKKHRVDHAHVCMEASSTYGEELARYLHDAGHTVSVVNPARIKGFAQSELLRLKNDKIDAGVIARFCDRMRPEPWKPLPPQGQTTASAREKGRCPPLYAHPGTQQNRHRSWDSPPFCKGAHLLSG